jgi:hypothetical protein
MSMFLIENEEIITFTDYIISESVRPKEITYGTNKETDNGEFGSKTNYYYTFFNKNEKYYMVVIDKKGNFGFGVNEKEFSDDIEDYDDSRKQTRNALTVFSHIVYVLLEFANKSKIKHLKFSAADPALGNVYSRMVKNKQLLNDIEQAGYRYFGLIDDNYIFVRK